jgi:hypothetical protein
MGPRFPSRLAIAWLVLGGGVAAAVGVAAWWRHQAPARLARSAPGWATERVLTESDSVYRLTFGRLTYDAATRSLTLDSLRIDTDTARNARRPRPLPAISATFRRGQVNRVSVGAGLGRPRRFDIGAIRFDHVAARVVLPSPSRGGSRPSSGPSAGAGSPAGSSESAPERPIRSAPARRAERSRGELEWRPPIALPRRAPKVKVGRIELPSVAMTIQSAAGGSLPSQHLPRIALRLDDLEVSVGDGGKARVRLGDLHLRAERYSGAWDSLTSMTIARVEASAADSLLRVDSVEVRPTRTLGEQRRRSQWRDTRVGASIPAMEAHGVDYGALLSGHAVLIRMLEIAPAKLDLLLDKHREPDPRPEPARMPNDIMRRLPLHVTIDTIRGSGGTISYGELAPGRRRPGVVTFEQIRGSIANLSNDPHRMSDQRPLVLTATASLMGTGRFSTVLEIPLLADRFSMRYRGTLGPMPLAEFNRFAAVNTPTKVRQGEVLGLAFDARVVDGHATAG